jgi:hypothetical protein
MILLGIYYKNEINYSHVICQKSTNNILPPQTDHHIFLSSIIIFCRPVIKLIIKIQRI